MEGSKKVTKIGISYSDLRLFNVEKETRNITNLVEVLNKLVGVDKLNSFISFYTNIEVNELSNASDVVKYHAIGTLILNAIYRVSSNWSSFGMEHYNMVCVTYHNSSAPNILYFYVIKQ